MRLIKATLHGLIGVYSASGKKEIFIDFTKCHSNIILIIGKNGSGKTTIWEALQPIPLPPSKFINKEPGFVELIYSHEDVEYIIRIEYPITNSRDRGQTKAFITKILSDGSETQLNPNGNIGSYKSALFNEFNLDPNFVSLSQLSSEDMGIVSKRPSERKKFVSSILENIEAYNGIYKSLTKRSNIFKSMINSITAKIDTIGNRENLLTKLNAIDNRLHRLESEKTNLVAELAKSCGLVQITDPHGELQRKYKSISDELYIVNQKRNSYNIYIANIESNFNTTSLDELVKLHKLLSDKLYAINVGIENATSALQDLLLSREEEAKYIQIKSAKINSLQAEFNFDYLKDRLKEVRKRIGECELIFSRLNLHKILTKDEFIHGVGIMKDIKDAISAVKSFSSDEVLKEALSDLKSGNTCIEAYNITVEKFNNLSETRNLIDKELDVYYGLLDYMRELEKRPKDCSIDECPFIKTALECSSRKPNENIERLEQESSNIEEKLSETRSEKEFLEAQVQTEKMISNIARTIYQNRTILNKFPTGRILTDSDTFFDSFTSVTIMDSLTDLQDSLQYANTFEQYKEYQTELVRLESDYKIYQNKMEIIDDLNLELEELNKKMSTIVSEIESKRENIRTQKESQIELDEKIVKLDNSIRILKELEEADKEKDSLETQLESITSSMESIKVELERQTLLNSNISNLDNEIKPTSDEKDTVSYSLKKLDEYEEELSLYNDKYNLIQLIKKYSSPTKGGIQTLFMQLYMGKTISMANELLSLLFDGKFELLPYVINENEFRIPCINKESSVRHDDISSCSSAERAMISMMISFSLLHHSSTVYNILRLDEIDGALDQSNRSKFLLVLDKFMKDLGVENCVMISHSSEMDMSNVDIIQLIPVDNNKPNGNIIFTYND